MCLLGGSVGGDGGLEEVADELVGVDVLGPGVRARGDQPEELFCCVNGQHVGKGSARYCG